MSYTTTASIEPDTPLNQLYIEKKHFVTSDIEMATAAPPKNSEQTDNLTGSLITLITNAQVRYEGTLIEINRTERSMNLSNVRSFGTEGRRDGKNEIQPHENIIQSVVFKVDHVKDFQIIKRPEKATPAPEPKEELQDQDPAIISSEQ